MRTARTAWAVAVVAVLAGCADGTGPTTTLAWYSTCGDPVCNTYSGPFDGVPVCASESEGASCDVAGATCDLENDCNQQLVCAGEDPKDQTGGCPISLRRYKRDVHYLTPDELGRVGQATRSLRLATWRYLWDAGDAPPRLGFVIDDDPTSPAVAADGQHVDVYGLASMAVAAVQAQQAELDALRARTVELEARLATVEARCPAP
ncbi:MAG: tail fiber domain-containing protein [Alphaproteobacteria bacterium]|nr:tail fiber domain-containing protein [Alphaproteobacteria bacterium]